MGDFFENLVYSETDVITFAEGIPGFEEHRSFVLVQIPEYVPFEWLVCIDGSKLRLAVINPLLFKPDYAPRIQKEQLQELGIEKAEDILMYVVVTIRENPLDSTANLVGPVVINKTAKVGRQIIIEDDRYSTQARIMEKK